MAELHTGSPSIPPQRQLQRQAEHNHQERETLKSQQREERERLRREGDQVLQDWSELRLKAREER